MAINRVNEIDIQIDADRQVEKGRDSSVMRREVCGKRKERREASTEYESKIYCNPKKSKIKKNNETSTFKYRF